MFNTKQLAEKSDHFLLFFQKEENKTGVLNGCFLYTDRPNASHTTLTEEGIFSKRCIYSYTIECKFTKRGNNKIVDA